MATINNRSRTISGMGGQNVSKDKSLCGVLNETVFHLHVWAVGVPNLFQMINIEVIWKVEEFCLGSREVSLLPTQLPSLAQVCWLQTLVDKLERAFSEENV